MKLKIIPSLIALLSLTGLGTEVRADNFIQVSQFRPADTTEPAYREDGGTRGPTIIEGGSGLIALTPVTGGVTVAEYPTVLVLYNPVSHNATEAIMGLKDEADNVLYETTIQLPSEDSIIAINLKQDEDSVPLETNQTYRWYIYYDSRYTEVPITRTNFDSEFAQTLEQANLQERFNLYKNLGIWYEALHTLFELRRAKPNDPTLIQEWQELLQFVGLEKIADVPLVLIETPTSQNQPQNSLESSEEESNPVPNKTRFRPAGGGGGGGDAPPMLQDGGSRYGR